MGFVWRWPVARLGNDDGKKVNAIKFYDPLDRAGCILFKVFTVYLRSGICARVGFKKLDVATGRKFTVFFRRRRFCTKLSGGERRHCRAPVDQGFYNACVKFRFRYARP